MQFLDNTFLKKMDSALGCHQG